MKSNYVQSHNDTRFNCKVIKNGQNLKNIFLYFPYQVTETSEKGIGQHEFPSLLYPFRNWFINIIGCERADSDEYNYGSQPHFTVCVQRPMSVG